MTAMELNELSRYNKTQTATTVLTSAAPVNLTEWLEDKIGLLLCEAASSIQNGIF